MAWIVLFIAGLFEVGFALGLKLSEGFTRLWPVFGMLVSGGISFYLLSLAMRTLPVGAAYAIWTGIGATGAVVVGIIFLEESSGPFKLLSIALILAGVAGLRLTEGS